MHCNNGLNNKLVESLVENKVAEETGDLKYLQDSMYDFVKTLKEIILGEYSSEFFNKYVDEALKLHGSNLEEFLKIPKMGLELRQALNSIDDAIDTSNQEFRDNLALLLDKFQTTLDNIEYEARSPYDIAVKYGFEGTEEEWLSNILNSSETAHNIFQDAKAFADFLYKPADITVKRRLAPSVHTLQYYVDRFVSIDSNFTQALITANTAVVTATNKAIGLVDNVTNNAYEQVSSAIEGIAIDANLVTDALIKTVPKGVGGVQSNQSSINRRYLKPEDFGAVGDGITDDTLAFAAMMDALNGAEISLSKKVYAVTGVVVPDNTKMSANGATLKRLANTYKPVLRVGKHSLVDSVLVDGNEPVLLKQLWNGDDGILIDNYGVLIKSKSFNNHGHGVRLNDNSMAFKCESFDNGLEASNGPKWGGWGDGFNITSRKTATLIGCTAWNNYRTGIVGTTGADVGSGPGDNWVEDPSMSAGYLVINCKSFDNYYSDTNFEGVGSSTITNSELGSFTFSKSANLNINNCVATRVYADNVINPTLRDITVKKSNATNAFFVRGSNPVVTGVRIICEEGKSSPGASIEVYDTVGGSSELSDVHITKGANLGVRTDVGNVSKIYVVEPTGYRLNYLNYYNSLNVSDEFKVSDGYISYRSSALLSIPTTGNHKKGTTVFSTRDDDPNYALICTKSGNFTTDTPKFKLVAFNKTSVNLSVPTGALPTAITDANSESLNNTFYWLESSPTNLPTPTNGASINTLKATLKTYTTHRTSGNYGKVQELYLSTINEKWVRGFNGAIPSWTDWKMVF